MALSLSKNTNYSCSYERDCIKYSPYNASLQNTTAAITSTCSATKIPIMKKEVLANIFNVKEEKGSLGTAMSSIDTTR